MLGISFDKPEDNKAFAERYSYTFPLLCDVDRKVGLAYGACNSAKDRYASRITFVIGPNGKIEQTIVTRDPAGQAAELLATIPPAK